MKIHAYQVVPRGRISLAAVLRHIDGLALRDRVKVIGGVPMRLEYDAHERGYWFLDFTMIRREGPGKASPATAITDFELADNEGFCEETAVCLHPGSQFMTLQYNHRGPRHGRIQTYLFTFAQQLAGVPPGGDDDNGFTFTPILTAEAADRLDNMHIVKKITMSFFVPGLTAIAPQRRRSITSLLELPIAGNAEKIHFEVAARKARGQSLRPQEVRRAVRELLGAREDLTDLRVVAKEDDNGRGQPIDFLDARLEHDAPIELRRGSRRYAREDRFAELGRTFQMWRDQGLLR